MPCTPDRQGGAEIAARLLPEVAQVDTMICYNDLVALGLMKPLEQAGIKVPEELDRIAGRNAQQGIVISPDRIWRATTPAV
ncbi:MAG: hypothetical protein DI537_25170 [Stutzerimonas stutzeri]|nr:MAG: hypothetical protein DI537_25170 [Stutzerimonas stutzeri]